MIDYVSSFVEALDGALPDAWGGLWVARIAGALIVTLVYLAIFKLLRALAARLEGRVRELKGVKIRAIRFQNQALLTEEQGAALLATFVRWVTYAVLGLLIYSYLQVAFSLFPATQAVAEGLLGYVLAGVTAVGRTILAYLPRLATLLVLLFVAKWALYFVRLLFDGLREGRIRMAHFYPEWATPTYGLVRIILIALTVVMAFPYLPGSGSQAFRGVSIFLGILFSLASTGVVAHVISGMALTYTRAFRVGDMVKIADAVGVVEEKTSLVTRLKTAKNESIAIPNGMVMSNPILNYSARADDSGVILHTTVTIGYDVPWETVHEALLKAAAKTDGIERDPVPFVRQTSLGDFYAAYEINVWTRNPEEMGAVYSQLHQNLQDALHAAGIEIASPHLSAVRDGNTINVPVDSRPEGYEPGIFRLGRVLFPER